MDTTEQQIKERLEYLRGEIKAERISYDEIHELQSLAKYIEPGDVELLQWAGVPEFSDEHTRDLKDRLQKLLTLHRDEQGTSDSCACRDAITDIMLLCDDLGINFDAILDGAREDYEQIKSQ